jgi:predicted kinase
MEDVATLIDARAPKPDKRGPYRERADLRRMPTVHLIHGFLGAGKTAFARRLEADLPAVRFTHDEWMATLYGDDPPMEQFPEYFRRVSDQIGSIWPRCAELGLDVVLDLNFWSRKQRDKTRALVTAIGATPRLYRLVCSDDEAWRRIDQRNTDLSGGLFVARSTFEVLKNRFEPLDSDEERVEVPNENSI